MDYPYSRRMRKNGDQKNSEYEHFSGSVIRVVEKYITVVVKILKNLHKYSNTGVRFFFFFVAAVVIK